MDPNCLFCKLKNVPSNIVYQDSQIYVLVDRFPLSNRHLLLIPKTHCAVLHDCEDSVLEQLLVMAKKIALKLKLDKYNLLQNNVNGQVIHHLHLHLIGYNETGGFHLESSNKELKFSDEEYAKLRDEIKGLLLE